MKYEKEKQLLVQKIKLDYEERNCRYGKYDLQTNQQWPRIGDNDYQILSLLGNFIKKKNYFKFIIT